MLVFFLVMVVYSLMGILVYWEMGGNMEFFFVKYLLIVVGGLFLMYLVYLMYYMKYFCLVFVFLLILVFLLIYIIVFGVDINDVCCWIEVFFVGVIF